MKLFSRKRKAETQSISTNPTIQQINEFFNTNSITDIGSSKLNSATYYACMQIRCNALAKLPLKIMRWSENGSEVATDHPLYELFKLRPNPYISAHDFLWATEFQRLEYGNAFWVKDFKNGKIKNLYLLDSSSVNIIVDNAAVLGDSESVYYVYNDAKKGQIIYQSDEIVHFKNFACNGIKGTSIKHYLYDVVTNEQYAQRVISEKYKSGLQDPLVVVYTGDLNEAKQAKIVKKFTNMGGAKNAGKVIPIPSDFDIKQLETRLVNSQFFELQGLTVTQIANAFGVKSFQLNNTEKSTYNNIEHQNRAFYSETLQNVLITLEQEIDYKLLFDFERKKGLYSKFNADAMLRSDIKTRYEAYQTGISSGFLQIAEVRKKEDLPFVKGTDRLIIGNGASIPLSDLGKQYPGKGGE